MKNLIIRYVALPHNHLPDGSGRADQFVGAGATVEECQLRQNARRMDKCEADREIYWFQQYSAAGSYWTVRPEPA